MKKSKIDKMLRLADIKQPINESFVNKWVEVIKESSDGNTYCIVEENKKYHIMVTETKETIKESDLGYVGGLKNKSKNSYKTYRESVNALSYLLHENNRNDLISETVNVYESDYKLVEGEYVKLDEKKFVLKQPKQPKPKKQPKDDFNFDMGSGESSEDDFNFDMDSEEDLEGSGDDFNFDMDSEDSSEEDSDEDFNFDMDSEEEEMGDSDEDFNFDMDSEEEEMEGDDLDLGGEELEDEGGIEYDGDDNIKKIQSTTGKLGQQLRDTEDLSSDTQKWVIKSVISALNLDKIDSSDKEDIVNSIESSGEETEFMGDVNYMGEEEKEGEENLLLDGEEGNSDIDSDSYEQAQISRILKMTNEGMSNFMDDDTKGGMSWMSEEDTSYMDESYVDSLPDYKDTEEAPVKTPVETPSKPKRRQPFRPNRETNPNPKANSPKEAPVKTPVETPSKPKRRQPFRPNRETNPNPKAFNDRDLDFDSLLNSDNDVTFE